VPLVSDYTLNLGLNYTKPMQSGLEFVVRGDLRSVGDTYWGPGDPDTAPLPWNTTVRDPVNTVDLRLGVQAEDWSAMFWAKNLTDEEYNEEWSHPFAWKALPRRWGIQYTKDF
jgi:iron complex outermembrane receptor protein